MSRRQSAARAGSAALGHRRMNQFRDIPVGELAQVKSALNQSRTLIKIQLETIEKLRDRIEQLTGCTYPDSSDIAVIEINGQKHATSSTIANEIHALEHDLRIHNQTMHILNKQLEKVKRK
jgi:hypothetical protein